MTFQNFETMGRKNKLKLIRKITKDIRAELSVLETAMLFADKKKRPASQLKDYPEAQAFWEKHFNGESAMVPWALFRG